MSLPVLILDGVSILLLVFCIWSAAMKGFIRTVAQVLAYMAILGISSYGSGLAAPMLYDKLIAPVIAEKMEEQRQSMENALFASTDTASDSGLLSAAAYSAPPEVSAEEQAQSASPSFIRRIIDWFLGLFRKGSDVGTEVVVTENQAEPVPAAPPDDNMGILPEVLKDLPLDDFSGLSIDNFGQELMDDFLEQSVRPIAVAAVGAVCFVVLFAVLSLVANILLRMLGVIDYVPVLGRVNRALGAVLGLLEGLLLVWLVGLFLRGMLSLYNGSWWIFTFSSLRSGFLFPLLSEPMWILKSF